MRLNRNALLLTEMFSVGYGSQYIVNEFKTLLKKKNLHETKALVKTSPIYRASDELRFALDLDFSSSRTNN